MWSGTAERGMSDPPAIGATIKVTMNGLGDAAVVGYMIVGGYLGLKVRLMAPPDWWVKQTQREGRGIHEPALVFGAEVQS